MSKNQPRQTVAFISQFLTDRHYKRFFKSTECFHDWGRIMTYGLLQQRGRQVFRPRHGTATRNRMNSYNTINNNTNNNNKRRRENRNKSNDWAPDKNKRTVNGVKDMRE